MSALRHFASNLGLSITTVSRALDGYGDVAEATRERVRKAALAQGYRPNPVARRLRKGSSETVAVVMPTEPGRFYEPAFVDLLGVVGERLAMQRFHLMLMAARPGPDEQGVYRRIVEDRVADACILVRTRRDDERVRYLQAKGVPFVCHGRTDSGEPYAFVDGDGEAGFAAATMRLIGRGHRRLAHIAAPGHFTFADLRARGWRRAMREAGAADDLFIETAASEEAGAAAATRLLMRADRPTALVCATDRIAIGAVRAAQTLGLDVGRDVAVIGHDNIHASAFTNPPLTTMELDVREVGETMADALLALIDNPMAERAGQVLPISQIPRASSGEGG